MAAASAVAASVSQAASVATSLPALKATVATVAASAAQPFSIAVDSLPPGGWLQYTQVIGTLLIALSAAFVTWRIQTRQVAIAHQAAETARNKLKLDLFDRRWKMYESARRLIAAANTPDLVNSDLLNGYEDATAGAKWIFNNGTQAYFEILAEQARELNRAKADRIEHESDEAFGQRFKPWPGMKTWWKTQRTELDKVMVPFMHLREGHVPEDERELRLFSPPPPTRVTLPG